MSYDDWPDEAMEARRAAVRKTIRPATLEELEDLGAKQFPVASDPWCERYHAMLSDKASAKFYRAELPGGVQIIYCRDCDKGIWFLPDSGMGIIQPKGLKALAEIVDAL